MQGLGLVGRLLESIRVWLSDRAVEVTSIVLLKFSDDTKVARVVENKGQREELQNTINRLVEWSTQWQMLFNSGKCHILDSREKRWE